MNTETNTKIQAIGPDFFERSWEESWTYIKTVVDVVHEPVLILDRNLCVLAANESFYRVFQVEARDTEKKLVYKLGNGQWNILALKKLLEDILPKNSFFKGFEVSHDFPTIGHKVMILNARQIHIQMQMTSNVLPQIILLAIEDVTHMMDVAKKLADHTNGFENDLIKRTQALEDTVLKLSDKLKSLDK